jgi:hypothetical protein
MTANTKIIIPVPFPAAPLIVKFRILGLYSICKSNKKDKCRIPHLLSLVMVIGQPSPLFWLILAMPFREQKAKI